MRHPKPEAERTANAKRVAKSRAKKDARIAELEAELASAKKKIQQFEGAEAFLRQVLAKAEANAFAAGVASVSLKEAESSGGIFEKAKGIFRQ